MKRCHVRKGLALVGFALAVPSFVWADTPEGAAVGKPWLNSHPSSKASSDSSSSSKKSSSPRRFRWFRGPGEVSQDDADKLVKQGVVPAAPGSQVAPVASPYSAPGETATASTAARDPALTAAANATAAPAPPAATPAAAPAPAQPPAPAQRRWKMFRLPGEVAPQEVERLIKKKIVTPPPVAPPASVSATDRYASPGESAPTVAMASATECKPCQEAAAAAAAPAAVAARTITLNADPTPGRALATDMNPGRAVAGNLVPMVEPTPVGVYQVGMNQMGMNQVMAGRPGPGAPGPGAVDPNVMMSSYASNPVGGSGPNHPNIITNLTPLTIIGRRRAVERERKKREDHASIPYLPLNQQTVTDLPSSMVYGRKATQ